MIGNESSSSSAVFHLDQSELDLITSSHGYVPLTLYSLKNSLSFGNANLTGFDVVVDTNQSVEFSGTLSAASLNASAGSHDSQVC